MMRLRALLLFLCSACSTMPQFTVEEHMASDGGMPAPSDGGLLRDGGRDAGWPTLDGGFVWPDGGFVWPDGGSIFPEAAWPMPDAGPVDFDYDCMLYGISPACRPLQASAPCPRANQGEACFGLPGYGLAQLYSCQSAPTGAQWTPTQSVRCAYDCDAELPTSSLFNLDVSDCGSRPARPCTRGEVGTTQQAVDAIFGETIEACGIVGIEGQDQVTAGMTLSAQGCPDVFFSSLRRVPPMARECVEALLEKLRFDCPTGCARTTLSILR